MEKFQSQQNNERLEQLTNVLGFSSIRLMIDPQTKPLSSEAVIEDICMFLEDELHPDPESKPRFSFSSKK